MTKLKQAAKSRKTVGNGLWLTLLLSAISAASANWPALRSAISPEWWFVGTVIIAALTKGLHWWQERQA